MNFIPSGKPVSIKNKKPPSTASEKYEQRIKDAKIKKNDQLMSPSWSNLNNNYYEYGSDWLKKRSDIDNWRRNVTNALQNEAADCRSSINSLDTGINPDSSTLTATSTLLSAGEIYSRNVHRDQNGPRAIFDLNDNKVINSPSNPVQSSFIDHKCFPKEYYRSEENRFLDSQSMEDDVFVPANNHSYFSNSKINQIATPSKIQSSLQYNDHTPQKLELHTKEFNSKYTPQAIKRPWYLPISKKEVFAAKSFDQSPPITNFTDRYFKPTTRENGISSQDHGRHNDMIKNEYPLSSSKRNLHKTETNAKLILRNSNSASNNDPPFKFIRNHSLNNKQHNMNDYGNLTHLINGPEKPKCITVLSPQSPPTNFKDNKPKCFMENGLVKNLSITNLSSIRNQQKLDVLVPTCSHENLSSRATKEGVYQSKMIKNNSFSNLRDQNNFIPKVSINKPLVLKFAFSSQPDLTPHFVNNRQISIFS